MSRPRCADGVCGVCPWCLAGERQRAAFEPTPLVTDFSQLHDQNASKHPAYPRFVEAMKGRMYGGEALDSAWSWFRKGWGDGMKDAAGVLDSYSADEHQGFGVRNGCTMAAGLLRAAKGEP